MSNLITIFAFIGRLYAIKCALDYDLEANLANTDRCYSANMVAWKLSHFA